MSSETAKLTSFSYETLNHGSPVKLNHSSIDQIKSNAHGLLTSTSFPTSRDEEWRFTGIRSLGKNQFEMASDQLTPDAKYDTATVPEAEKSTLVFVNGVLSPDLSKVSDIPKGVILSGFADAAQNHPDLLEKYFNSANNFENDYFVLLNTSLFRDGVFVYVPKEVKVEQIFHVVYITTGSDQSATFPRNLIVAERHSEFTVVEEYIGNDQHTYLTTSMTEIILGQNAKMAHVRLQKDGLDAFHINRIVSKLSNNADLQSYTISLGASLFRNDVRAIMNGEGSHATLDGLVLASENQLSDTHSIMDHQMPNCTSHQLHKTIVDGRATSVFNGKIFVRKDAQKTDAFQENHNLQLSRDGQVYTKPQLEIFADDVKCSHGATIGQLNEEQEFYLRSRGLSDFECREILTYGFATEVIESLPVESIKNDLKKAVESFTKRGIQSLVIS
jgi:Fe-S cluster assembly protein SufD